MAKTDSILPIDSIMVHKTVVIDSVLNIKPETGQNTQEQIANATGINPLTVIGIIVTAIILIVVFKLVDKYLKPILISTKKVKQPELLVFRIKSFTWLIFAIFCFYQIIIDSLAIGFSMVVFTALIGLFFWKDFFIGLFYKLEGKIKVNDFIEVNQVKGKVIKFNKRNIEISAENESIQFIPYRTLINATIAKKSNKNEIRSKKIIVETTLPHNVLDIEKVLLNCPWIYNHRPNAVSKIDDNKFEIRVYGTNNFTYNKIEDFLKENLN
jgi:small-conductance mechanosensitive channel